MIWDLNSPKISPKRLESLCQHKRKSKYILGAPGFCFGALAFMNDSPNALLAKKTFLTSGLGYVGFATCATYETNMYNRTSASKPTKLAKQVNPS